MSPVKKNHFGSLFRHHPGGVGADPQDALIIVPVRNTVLFPGVVAPITIGRPKSIAAAQQALRDQRPIGILLQRNAEANDPGPDELYRICTVANIVRYITAPDETHHIICQGVQRARILDFLPGTPFSLRGFCIFRSPRRSHRRSRRGF